jgi:Flp pilus assembly protein TadG
MGKQLEFKSGNGISITANAQDVSLTIAATSKEFTQAEKTKLETVEANQNAFSNVVIGSVTVAANNKTDTFTLVAGTGVTITANAANKTITVAANTDSILSGAYTSIKVGSVII